MLSRIKSILKRKGYTLFERPYELNIVGMRANQTKANRFDDEIHVFFKTDHGDWDYHIFKATTDPGTFWLKNPMQPQGTAILAAGQYFHSYMIGQHKGQYKALVQTGGPVNIIRDYDRNAKLDFISPDIKSGYFGINIHRASANGTTQTVDRYSAGCQVFQNADDFQKFLGFCDKHRKLYGNQFTYTLVDFRAVKRENFRRLLMGAASLLLSFTGLMVYAYEEPEKKTKGKLRDLDSDHKRAA